MPMPRTPRPGHWRLEAVSINSFSNRVTRDRVTSTYATTTLSVDLATATIPAVHQAPLILLDSSHPQERSWASAAARPEFVMRCDARTLIATLSRNGERIKSWDDPLQALGELDRPASDCALATRQQPGRWIGFLSYDLGRLFERLPSVAADDVDVPLFAFAFCRDADGDGEERVESLVAQASRLCPPYEKHSRDDRATKDSNLATVSSADPRSTFTPADYIATVNRVLEYIRAGDIFQANLSQRFTIERNLTPIQIYQNLLQASPARFGGLLDFGDFVLICNSPELFLRVATDANTGKRRVITRPIKGTRPRARGMEQQLRESIKDQAELNMIVDLERNDLGRVCQIASVKVTEPRTIETHPTVYHGACLLYTSPSPRDRQKSR